MKETMKTFPQRLFTGVFLVYLSGCAAGPAAKTGFIKNYSQLQPHPEIEGRYSYVNIDIDTSKYKKFIVDPVAINLSEKGKERAENYELKDIKSLAKYFRKQIGLQLRKNYRLVKNPGPGVMRIRTSISEIERTLPYLNIHPGTKIIGGGLGGAGAEIELVDSVSNERIAAAIDNQKGSRLDIVGGLSWYGNAKTIMDKWAEEVKRFVDNTCEIPE